MEWTDDRWMMISKVFWRKRSLPSWGTIPKFAWRDWGKPKKPQSPSAVIPAAIPTEHLPNRNQKWYNYANPFGINVLFYPEERRQVSPKLWCISAKLLTYGAEPFLRSRQLCSYSRISQYFKEPKVHHITSHHLRYSVHILAIFGLTCLLMELRPSSEAANCVATQELPSILKNPKVHYRVHKSLSLVPILSQIDPVQTTPSCLSKIYFNIV
jgi:hypothetical protein